MSHQVHAQRAQGVASSVPQKAKFGGKPATKLSPARRRPTATASMSRHSIESKLPLNKDRLKKSQAASAEGPQNRSVKEETSGLSSLSFYTRQGIESDVNGNLIGSYAYRIPTFTLPGKETEPLMLAQDCAYFMALRNTDQLFRRYPSLARFLLDWNEMKDIELRKLIPPRQDQSKRLQRLFVVPARSMFIQFGRRVVEPKAESSTTTAEVECTKPALTSHYISHETPVARTRQMADDKHESPEERIDRSETIAQTPPHNPVECGISEEKAADGNPESDFAGASVLGTGRSSLDRVELLSRQNRSVQSQESISLDVMAASIGAILSSSDPELTSNTTGTPHVGQSVTINQKNTSLIRGGKMHNAIQTFYSLCKDSLKLVHTVMNDKPTTLGSSSTDQADQQLKTEYSPRKRKLDARDDFYCGSQDHEKQRLRCKKTKQTVNVSTELPCWWYMRDPIRYNICASYCSRDRDLHSYRRHHFDDHWRWGDVQGESIPFETWNAAKHASCNIANKTTSERAKLKWVRTYRLLFGLSERDPVPDPTCPNLDHVHHKPKRPFIVPLPTARQDSDIAQGSSSPVPDDALPEPLVRQQLPEADPVTSSLPAPTLLPPWDADSLIYPDTTEFDIAWNNRVMAVDSLSDGHSHGNELNTVVDRHITKIGRLLDTMRSQPEMISYTMIREVLSFAADFERSYTQAILDSSAHVIEGHQNIHQNAQDACTASAERSFHDAWRGDTPSNVVNLPLPSTPTLPAPIIYDEHQTWHNLDNTPHGSINDLERSSTPASPVRVRPYQHEPRLTFDEVRNFNPFLIPNYSISEVISKTTAPGQENRLSQNLDRSLDEDNTWFMNHADTS